jgi:large subunit ribosomal protein L2
MTSLRRSFVAVVAATGAAVAWCIAQAAFVQPSHDARMSSVIEGRRYNSSPSLAGAAIASPDSAVRARPTILPIFAIAFCAAVAAMRSQVQRRAKGKPQTTSGIRIRKPMNNALRNSSIATFEECTTKQRYEPLTIMFRRRFARPRGKSIHMSTRTARESGHKYLSMGGYQRHARRYRIIDFGRKKRGMFGTIETIEYDPYRNCRICLVKYEDGERRYILHAFGFFVGQQVISDRSAPIFVGNAMPLEQVPIGTMVHNIEMHPRFGGALVRAAGTAAVVLSREKKFVTVKLPSSEVRLLHKNCWCTIGKVGRPEAQLIKLGKAGKTRQLGWTPHVRGVPKNACDHPHGGGEGRSPIGQKHPKTPFGKCAYGLKTRRRGLVSQKMILIRRKKKSGRA